MKNWEITEWSWIIMSTHVTFLSHAFTTHLRWPSSRTFTCRMKPRKGYLCGNQDYVTSIPAINILTICLPNHSRIHVRQLSQRVARMCVALWKWCEVDKTRRWSMRRQLIASKSQQQDRRQIFQWQTRRKVFSARKEANRLLFSPHRHKKRETRDAERKLSLQHCSTLWTSA